MSTALQRRHRAMLRHAAHHCWHSRFCLRRTIWRSSSSIFKMTPSRFAIACCTDSQRLVGMLYPAFKHHALQPFTAQSQLHDAASQAISAALQQAALVAPAGPCTSFARPHLGSSAGSASLSLQGAIGQSEWAHVQTCSQCINLVLDLVERQLRGWQGGNTCRKNSNNDPGTSWSPSARTLLKRKVRHG